MTVCLALEQRAVLRAAVEQDAAFQVEHGFQAAAKVLGAAQAPARGVHAAGDDAGLGATRRRSVRSVFNAGVDQAIDLHIRLRLCRAAQGADGGSGNGQRQSGLLHGCLL
jgi:hypothetical protein